MKIIRAFNRKLLSCCLALAAAGAWPATVFAGCWIDDYEVCLPAGYCLEEVSGQCYQQNSEGPVNVDYCDRYTETPVSRPTVIQAPNGESGHVDYHTYTYSEDVSVMKQILNLDCTLTHIPHWSYATVYCDGAKSATLTSAICVGQ